MTRPILWTALLGLLAIAWPTLAEAPPNLERTLEAQQELVSGSPHNPVAWNDLGNLLVLSDREAEAEEAYRRAISLGPDTLSARFNLALLLQQTGRVKEAESELDQLLGRDSHHAWAHYQLGMILASREDRKMALEHYARALAYDPSLSFASNNPHIIDNPLFSEALIMSQRYLEKTSARVPRQYGEANRIVDLMLEGEDDEESGGEAESGDEMERGGEEGSEEVEEAPLAGGGPRNASRGSATAPPAPSQAQPSQALPSQAQPRTTPTGSSRTTAPPSQVRAGTRVVQPSAPRDSRARDTTRSRAEDGRTITSETTAPRRVGPQTVPPQTAQPQTRSAPQAQSTDRSGRSTAQRTSPRDRSSQQASPTPPRSSRYIPPSRRSSAQLELKLLPGESGNDG